MLKNIWIAVNRADLETVLLFQAYMCRLCEHESFLYCHVLSCFLYFLKPAGRSPQLHSCSLATLQQDMWRWDTATERQMPGVAVLLPDRCWPAWWWMRGGQTCFKPALLSYSLLWRTGSWRQWRGGGRGWRGQDTTKRRTTRLGVWGVDGVLRELWWRYGSILISLMWESKDREVKEHKWENGTQG